MDERRQAVVDRVERVRYVATHAGDDADSDDCDEHEEQ